VDELLSLSKKFGINPAGEGGEYETLVVNAPFFKCRLRVKEEGKEWEWQGDKRGTEAGVNAPLAVYSDDFLKHRSWHPTHPERPREAGGHRRSPKARWNLAPNQNPAS